MRGKVGTADVAMRVDVSGVTGLDSRIESKIVTYDVSEGQGLYSRNGGRSFGLDSRGGKSGDILSYDGSNW